MKSEQKCHPPDLCTSLTGGGGAVVVEVVVPVVVVLVKNLRGVKRRGEVLKTVGKYGENREKIGKHMAKISEITRKYGKMLISPGQKCWCVYEIAKLTYNECTLGGLLGDVNQLITMN